jgi:two-component system LytT family response regulator
MLRVAICEDVLSELQKQTQIIQSIMARLSKNVKFFCFRSGEELLMETDTTGNMDIVFLDVEMPGFDGIYVGNELKKQNESVIIFIVTSYLEYLDAAMRFHVFRYLSKPIDKQRLFQNLDDALELYYSINQKIAVETKYGVTSVLTCDIVYVEAKGRKVIVHTATADLDSTQTLQFWIEHLPQATFFQSHRSYIVNMAMVTSFDHELIYLCDGQFTAYLTRRKFTEFKKAYLMFMESKR